MPVSPIARLRTLLRKHGVVGAAAHVAEVLWRRVFPRRVPPHPFDLEHGVETGGLLMARKIRSGHPHDAQSTAYYGTQPSVFRAAMARWIEDITAAGQDVREFTFVDIGCGKGRALMLASDHPFRRVLGIELSPSLVQQAHENLARWTARPHPCDFIQVIECDVLDFALPDGPLLLYLYHPFEAELFGQWVHFLAAQLATRVTPVYVLYLNPYHQEMLGALPFAEHLWSDVFAFNPEESAARQLSDAATPVSLYRLTPAAHAFHRADGQ
jgi:SAM-dependent methyltransferase